MLDNETKKRNKFFLLLWVIKFTFDLQYVFVTSKLYYDWNASLNPNYVIYVMGLVVVLTFSESLWKIASRGRTSDILVFLISIGYFFPGLSACALGSKDIMYFTYMILYWALLIWLYLAVSSVFSMQIMPSKNNMVRKVSGILFHVTLNTIIIGAVIATSYYGGVNFSFSLSKAYELRKKAASLQLPIIIQHIRIWATYLTPFAILIYWNSRIKLYSFILVLFQLLFYGFDGFRFSLFLLVIAFGIIIFKRKLSIMNAGAVVIFSSVISFFEYYLTKAAKFFIPFHFRTFLIPVIYGGHYFDFFSSHELDYLRTSIMRRFGFVSPYSGYQGFKDFTYLIGRLYNNATYENANTGLLGDAFANFGWASLLIYPFVIVMIFLVIDTCCKRVNKMIQYYIAILYFSIYTNGFYFSILLSNGVLLFLFLLVLLSLSNIRRYSDEKEVV
ncbi:MAG: hypothetical protein ACOX6Y_01340 [Christensenellales bacterium]|jgi:hypothetical protein